MSEFRTWMRAMGLNSKQVSTAAEMLGITTVVASHLSRGKRELTQQERLAMAALLAGLKPWDESRVEECLGVKAMITIASNLRALGQRLSEAAIEFTQEQTRIELERASAVAAAMSAKLED